MQKTSNTTNGSTGAETASQVTNKRSAPIDAMQDNIQSINTKNIFSRNVITSPLRSTNINESALQKSNNIFSKEPIVANITTSGSITANSKEQPNTSIANKATFPTQSNQIFQKNSSNQPTTNAFSKLGGGITSNAANNLFGNTTTKNEGHSNCFANTTPQNTNNSNTFGIFNNKTQNTGFANGSGTGNSIQNQNQNSFTPAFNSNASMNQKTNPMFTQNNRDNSMNQAINPSPTVNWNQTPNNPINKLSLNTPNQVVNNFSSNYQTNGLFPSQNNCPNMVPNTQNPNQNISQIPPNELQLLKMLQDINITENSSLSTLANPYNLYNAKLMLFNSIDKVNRNYIDRNSVTRDHEQQQILVKDSPFKTEIIIMLKQMINTGREIVLLKSNLQNLNADTERLTKTLQSKLMASRQRMIEKIKWQKMITNIQEELNLIQNQLNDFIKPLFTSIQTNKTVNFNDPDTFCIEIAKSILSKMIKIQSNIKELASSAKMTYQSIIHLEEQNYLEANQIFSQLIGYFEAICIKFQSLRDIFDGQLQKMSQSQVQILKQEALEINEAQKYLSTQPIRNISKLLETRNLIISSKFQKNQ